METIPIKKKHMVIVMRNQQYVICASFNRSHRISPVLKKHDTQHKNAYKI